MDWIDFSIGFIMATVVWGLGYFVGITDNVKNYIIKPSAELVPSNDQKPHVGWDDPEKEPDNVVYMTAEREDDFLREISTKEAS